MLYVIYNTITKEILYQNFFKINEKEAKEVAVWYAMHWGIDNVRLVGVRGYDSIDDYDTRTMEERVKWIEGKMGKDENVYNISFGGLEDVFKF